MASVIRAVAAQQPMAGEVTLKVDLGLPLPPTPAGAMGLLSGEHRLRVWRSRDGLRVAELSPAGERAFFLSRDDAWAWESESLTAYHLGPLPTAGHMDWMDPERLLSVIDPLRFSAGALSALAPSTLVSMGPQARVAGRDSYVLTLRPRSRDTRIDRIEIGIDGEHRVPLSAAVFVRGSDSPAALAEFTSVDFGPIEPETFEFAPPPGAKIKGVGHEAGGRRQQWASLVAGLGMMGQVRTFGSGWGTVVAIRVPRSASAVAGTGALEPLLPFSGPLFSVTLAHRGAHAWLLVGAVPRAALAAAERKLP